MLKVKAVEQGSNQQECSHFVYGEEEESAARGSCEQEDHKESSLET